MNLTHLTLARTRLALMSPDPNPNLPYLRLMLDSLLRSARCATAVPGI